MAHAFVVCAQALVVRNNHRTSTSMLGTANFFNKHTIPSINHQCERRLPVALCKILARRAIEVNQLSFNGTHTIAWVPKQCILVDVTTLDLEGLRKNDL